MSNPQQDFIKSGFEFFPKAVDAVEEFAKLLQEDLKEAVKNVEAPPGVRLEAPTKLAWGSAPGKGCWVYALVPAFKGDVKFILDVGWWWNAPGAQTALVSYCSPFEGTRRLRLDGHAPSGVNVTKLNGSLRLCVNAPSPGSTTIEPLLKEGMRVVLADTPTGQP